jgi:hypothetical protein
LRVRNDIWKVRFDWGGLESNYLLFSYDKLFNLKPLTKAYLQGAAAGEKNVLDRACRLLPVCAAVATGLAIVLYVTDVYAAVEALRDAGPPSTRECLDARQNDFSG